MIRLVDVISAQHDISAQDVRVRNLVCCVVGRRPSRWSSSLLRAALLASVALATTAHAQTDQTWLANPASGDFNTAGNWSGNAVPTGTATFNASSQRIVGFSQDTALSGISLTAGAGAYTFNNSNNLIQLGTGLNVANGASVTVNNTSRFFFVRGSAVGNVVLNNSGGGELLFQDSGSSAGTARITNSSGALIFFRGASAGAAHIVNNDQLQFVGFGSSTAADATIENHGSMIFAGVPGNGGSTAANASITSDGTITFEGSSRGGTARLNMTGGSLDISGLTTGGTTLGSLEGKGNVFLGGNFLRIGGSNLSTIFAGVIQDGGVSPGGHGIIQKEGTGVFSLTGTSTYTGRTDVIGGALVVDGSIASSSGVTVGAGATLGGTGTVAGTTIQDGGTLVAGHNTAPFGALTVQGNLVFAAAATYMVQVSPLEAGRTNVTGLATLNGATVQAVFAPGTYVTRQSTILHANGGLNGQFGTLAYTPSPLFVASLSYDANNVFLNLRSLAPQFMPGNVNQRNVAGGIINSFNTVGGLPAEFLTVTPAGLTQLSGETAVGSQQATFDAMHQFMGVMLDPTVGGRVAPTTGGALMPRKAPALDSFGARWNLWAAGYGGSQTISGDAVLGSNKTTSNVFGSAIGADYHVSPNTVTGVALAGGGTNFRVANGGSGESDLFQAGAHLHHTQGAAFVAAALAYGWQDVTTKRTVTVDGIESLRGQFHTTAFSGRLESGFRVATQSIDLTPYAAGQFISYRLPSYAEQAASGTSLFALAYDGKTATAARSELGVKTEKAVLLSDAMLVLRSRLAWAHEFETTRSVSAAFQALPASAFVVNGARPAVDTALTSLSAELAWRNGWSAAATFDSQLSDTTRSYAGKGSVRYAW